MRKFIKATLRRIGLGFMYLVPITLVGGVVIYVISILGPASLFVPAILLIAWMVGDMVESTMEHKRYMKEWKDEINKKVRKESRP